MREIEINKKLPVITMNFEEVEESLQETMKKYEGIVVTEEGLKDCKATQKKLAGLRNNIDAYRKGVKKEMEAPIKDFEGKCKKLISLISDVEKPIKEGIKVYDDKRREEKKEKVLEYIKESIQAHNLSEKYAARLTIKDQYLNLTGSLKSIREDIESRAAALEKEQEAERQQAEMMKVSIENAIDTANEGINKKLKYEYFVRYIELGWPLDRILEEIRNRASMIKEAENPKEEVKVQEDKKEVVEEPKVSEKNNTDPKQKVREESKLFVKIHVEANLEKLQALSNFLKVNGYKYDVIGKGKVQ